MFFPVFALAGLGEFLTVMQTRDEVFYTKLVSVTNLCFAKKMLPKIRVFLA